MTTDRKERLDSINKNEVIDLAFESIPGARIVSQATERTFIAGDFFAVYNKGEEIPTIYRWSEIKSITENRTDFIIVAGTGSKSYKIPKSCISEEKNLLNLRCVFEGAVSANPQIDYKHTKRILPPKYLYMTGDMRDSPYTASGVYKEREINLSNVILLNTRIGKLFKIIAAVTILTIFIFLHFFYGNTSTNWFYFLPVSFFSGGIAVMLVYLICALIANFHFAYLFKVDPAVSEEITFAMSSDGFYAVESHLNTGYEFIPWSQAAYFIETNSVYIIYKNKKSVFWLPKRLFSKETQTEITEFISSKLQQK